MANELLPCPFCGGDDLWLFQESEFDGCSETITLFNVGCKTCVADIRGCGSKDGAIEAWNTRSATGLVNWLEWELSQADEVAGIVVRTKALQELRMMVKRLLGQ